MRLSKANYFRRLIDNDDPASSKRFLGLAMSAFLIIDFFVLLFTKVPNANQNLLDKGMLYAFLIVLMALFGLAVDKVAEILLSVTKVKSVSPQPTIVENAETVNTTTTKAETVNAEKVETVNTQNTNIAPGSVEQVSN